MNFLIIALNTLKFARFGRAALVATGVAGLPGAALSRDEACDFGSPAAWAAVAEEFVGFWEMEHLAGFAMSPAVPMALPFGADEPRPPVTLYRAGGQMFLTAPGMAEDLPLRFDTGPTRDYEQAFSHLAPINGLVPWATVEAALGCNADSLGRLIGEATVVEDGVSLDFTYRLIVTGTDAMYGVMHLFAVYEGQPVHMFRSVTMRKQPD